MSGFDDQEIERLQRKIAAGPARDWLETDDPDVMACMGSAPECAQKGCQARVIVEGGRLPALELHRCKICGTRWLLWPDMIHGGGWNLLDRYQRPGACCDNVAMGDQIEHLRDFDLAGLRADPAPQQQEAADEVRPAHVPDVSGDLRRESASADVSPRERLRELALHAQHSGSFNMTADVADLVLAALPDRKEP